MELIISNEIRIREATPQVVQYCRDNLVFLNPEYQLRQRRGMWLGNTPQYIYLYRMDGAVIYVPCGTGKHLRQFLGESQVTTDLADNGQIEYSGSVPLYDYQAPAVEAMASYGCGILQSPCGSGKTQMGIALAACLRRKALWVTHTKDLLTQSFERARQYFPAEQLGTITEGRVNIGSHITFATVQTLSKLDLTQYKYTWDVVIVDECHRVAGTPTQVTMFYRVISSLAARYKFGLSATVRRSDGLIKTTFAILGDIAYQVPEEAVKDKTMQVGILRRDTGVLTDRSCLDTDGTLVYSSLLTYLAGNRKRNELISADLAHNSNHYNLVLSDRLEHLRVLRELLPDKLRALSAMIDGSMTSKRARAERERAIEDMRVGRKHYLFASYALAKEGLDIPRLDRLYMVTPKKDYSVVTQSIGRIARVFDGKEDAVCYDYVDDIQFCENQWKRRRAHYRKARCIL